MNRAIDRKYHDLALKALHEGLYKQNVSPNNDLLRQELLEAFKYSRDILRENRFDKQINIIANNVFETCIRLTRCLFFPQEAKIIVLQEKEYLLDMEDQYDALKKNMEDLTQKQLE